MTEFSQIYTQEGQTLMDVAMKKYGTPEGVFLLLEDNPSLNGDMTAELTPGLVLNIRDSAPELDQPKLNFVRKGEQKQIIFSSGKSLSEWIAETPAADLKSVLKDQGALASLIAAMDAQECEDTLSIAQRNSLTRVRSSHTGSSTSYAVGDDAWHSAQSDNIKAHRRVQANFYKLLVNNPFGHKFRFCGVTGGYVDDAGTYKDISGNTVTRAQAFPDSYAIDMLTGLGWYLALQSVATWSNAIASAEAFTAVINGTNLDGWRIPDFKEITDLLANVSSSQVLNLKPFEFGVADTWTSTSRNSTTSRYVQTELQILQSGNSTTRTFTLCRNHYQY